MTDRKQDPNLHGRSGIDGVQKHHGPYWRRAHRDWRVWVVAILMIVCMIVYVMSEDLSLRPPNRPQQPVSSLLTK